MAIALLAILIFICLGAVYYLHSEINMHSLVLRKMNSDIQALMQRPMQIFPTHQNSHPFTPPSYIPAVDDDDDDAQDDEYGVCVEDTDSDNDSENDSDDTDATEEIVREDDPATAAAEAAAATQLQESSTQEQVVAPAPEPVETQEKKPSPPEEPAKNYDEGYEMEHEGVVYQVKQDKNGRKRWAKKSNKPVASETSAPEAHTLNLMD